MSDVYGSVSLSRSSDCACDLEDLRDFLNKFSWDQEHGYWEIDHNDVIFEPEQRSVPYPCISFIPRYQPNNPKNAVLENDDSKDDDDEEIDQNIQTADTWEIYRFSSELQKLLKSGYVSMICYGLLRGIPVTTTILTVHSDGRYRYHKLTHHSGQQAFEYLESS